MKNLSAIDAALAQIDEAELLVVAAIEYWRAKVDTFAAITDRKITPQEQREQADAQTYIHHLEHGLHERDGTHADVYALLYGPAMARFRFAEPGLAALRRLREQLMTERAALIATESQVWPQRFRYTGRKGKHQHDGRLVQPGEVVELTETQATAFGDRFEPATEGETAPVA